MKFLQILQESPVFFCPGVKVTPHIVTELPCGRPPKLRKAGGIFKCGVDKRSSWWSLGWSWLRFGLKGVLSHPVMRSNPRRLAKYLDAAGENLKPWHVGSRDPFRGVVSVQVRGFRILKQRKTTLPEAQPSASRSSLVFMEADVCSFWGKGAR